jgi:hypothetical protein
MKNKNHVDYHRFPYTTKVDKFILNNQEKKKRKKILTNDKTKQYSEKQK